MALEGYQDYLNLVLVILYGSLLVFALFQLGRIVCNRHKLKSFHSVFLLLCTVWMVLRVVLLILLLTTSVDDSAVGNPYPTPTPSSPTRVSPRDLPLPVYYPLAYIPLVIEFATYTLLILFFARVSYKLNPATKTLWDDRYKRRFFVTWGVVNVVFLVGVVVAIVLLCVGRIDRTQVAFRVARSLTAAVMFSTLVTLLAYYGYKLYKVLQDPMVRYIPFQSRGTSVPGITLLTGLLMVVFLCRTVYSIVLAIEYVDHPTFVGEEPVFRFLSLLVSELVPTFAILIFFRKIPTSKVRRRQLIPPVFYSTIQDRVGFFFLLLRSPRVSLTTPPLFFLLLP